MLKITKGQSNELTLTCSEKTSLENPYYLLELICEETQDKFYTVCTDTSSYPERYQTLTLSSSDIEDCKTGFYKYVCYEQSSAVNEDPDLTNAIVETGRAQIFDTATTTYTYTNTDISYTYNG